ncbi:MAG: thermonuclease family protein [Pseudomonadota bacterium]
MRRNRIVDFLKLLLLFLVLGGGSVVLAIIGTEESSGEARVVDGDSLFIGDKEIRLFGIDAPEYRQVCGSADRASSSALNCGQKSAAYLRNLIDDRHVACNGFEEDKYGRLLAVCEIGNLEINREMVLRGWAVAFGDYEKEEALAKKQAIGVWQGDFDLPSEWRRAEKQKHSKGWLGQIFAW